MIFNRYWICDRSGGGRGKWHYFSGEFYSDEDARNYIIEELEQWAYWAESYSMEVERDVVAPTEVIERELTRASNRAARAIEQIADLRTMLGYSESVIL